MTDLRVKPGVAAVGGMTADGIGYMPLRSTRDGAVAVIDWKLMLSMEGRAFQIHAGEENAPIEICPAIDDQKGFMLCDVPDGVAIIPTYAQAQIGVWQAAATLFNFMIEVDNTKVRYSSTGTAAVPLNMNTASTNRSACICYVGDVTPAAKTVGGSLELYRESVEVAFGNTGDYIPAFTWEPDVAPVIVGPASLIIHFGCTPGNGDPTGYGLLQWIELPAHQAS